MGLYLAYSIREEDFDFGMLERIMTDWFNFSIISAWRDYEGWLAYAKRMSEKFRTSGLSHRQNDDKNPLKLGVAYSEAFFVKPYPLLEIGFCYNDTTPHCPKDFSGLNIWAGHSGSEGIVDLIKIKPEMDRYLALNQIPNVDLSKTELY